MERHSTKEGRALTLCCVMLCDTRLDRSLRKGNQPHSSPLLLHDMNMQGSS